MVLLFIGFAIVKLPGPWAGNHRVVGLKHRDRIYREKGSEKSNLGLCIGLLTAEPHVFRCW